MTITITFGGTTDVVGSFPVTIIATDASGNTATLIWTVNVIAAELPVIRPNGGKGTIVHEATMPFKDPLAIIEDTLDGDLTRLLQSDAQAVVNVDKLGTYTITYSMSSPDTQGETAVPVERKVNVVDRIKPASWF